MGKKFAVLLLLISQVSWAANPPLLWGPGNLSTLLQNGLAFKTNTTFSLGVGTTTQLSGTISTTASSGTVTGVGTLFRQQLKIGQAITAGGETHTITAIASNTSLTTDVWTGANSGVTATRPASSEFNVYPNGNLQMGGTGASQAQGAPGPGATFLLLVGNPVLANAAAPQSASLGVLSYAGAGTGSTGRSQINFLRAAGNEGAQAAVASGDLLGQLIWRGATSATSYATGADIESTATENFGATSSGSNLVLKTTPNTTTAAIAALTLDQDQSAKFAGPIKMASVLISPTAPTVSSGFGSSPSIVANNGSAAFEINVGTGGSATNGVIGLPTATTGWNCYCTDITTNSSTVFMCKQTASSTTSATIGNFNTSAAAAAWVASDKVRVSCFAY